MFKWFKRKTEKPATGDLIVAQPPNAIFPWPKGIVLTAVDELVLALPVGLLEKDRPMSEFVFTSDHAQINLPPDSDTFFVRLLPGMSISLTKSVQSRVVADDGEPKRIRIMADGGLTPRRL